VSGATVLATAVPDGLGLMAGHGIVVPIVLPLVAGALLILLEQIRSRWVQPLSMLATLLLVAVCAGLFTQAGSGGVQAYLLGNWQAPFGIALALDRLSALMLVLTSVVALTGLLYATAGDDKRGVHFHSLFQLQLMGLNGAFLTADLFNLFVFFEVLLAASYGLLLHGDAAGRRQRVKASVHYVVFNLTGSALFLVAVSLLYALTGTLNMADLAVKIPQLAAENQRLAQAAALMLLVVFAVKAALLPLYFWLPDTYASATAPVAALFAILTKVGVYCIARATVLIFGAGAGGLLDGIAQPMLPALAMATIVLAAIGALAAPRLRALVAYLVVASAGTLLLAIGLGTPGTVAAGLFYLVPSTLVAAFFFLLSDRVLAARGGVASGCDALDARPLVPGTWAPLALAFFAAAIAAAGVPPLAGFLGKAMLLQAAGTTPLAAWVVAIVLTGSLALMVALARAGATLFWEGGAAGVQPASRSEPLLPEAQAPGARWARLLAMAIPASAVLALTIHAGSLAATTRAAAEQLFERQTYIAAVLGARPVPAAWDLRKEMRERGDLK
jgi:multicomponent K+:H+ antiporter subunit D